jgi:uncharacterized RDD family membrane protein YckC
MECINHVGVPTTRTCSSCGLPFCDRCLVNLLGRDLCPTCKPAAVRDVQHGQLSAGAENAGFGSRFLAMFLDGLILAIPTYAIQIPMMMSAGRRAALAPPPAPGAFPFAPGTCGTMLLSWLVVLTIQGTYFTWMIGARGQTIGKMALRLKVVRGDLSPVSYGRAFGRFWGYQLSSLTLGIGYLMVLFTKDHRALHDIVCDTRVVKI